MIPANFFIGNHMDANWLESFREKLENHYAWPSLYMFKFIVPDAQQDAVKKLLANHTIHEKKSKKGNYISISAEMMMPSSQSVIDIYIQASHIEGLIAL